MTRHPSVLVFDSGLGGLTVFAEVVTLRPEVSLVYAADDAGFPYGGWAEADLVCRVTRVMDDLLRRFTPDLVVIACNTASTLVLPTLRARFAATPFVGTVPAIKPAAKLSRSKMITVLGTPGTVARDYTRGLIASFASECEVTLVGSPRLASLAEASMTGASVDDAMIAAEIEPCFVAGRGGCRTDAVVLACTHYPLLLERFERLQPWPVDWIDPAPAIARRVDAVLRDLGFGGGAPAGRTSKASAYFTSHRRPGRAVLDSLARFGIASPVESEASA